MLFDGVALSLFVWVIFIKQTRRTMFGIDPSTSLLAERNASILMNEVAKHALLFGIAITFNPGYLILIVISAYDENWHFSDLPVLGNRTCQTLECAINVMVLWLILRKNYNKYICLCKHCHSCISRCCFENVDNKRIVENPYSDLPGPESENTLFLNFLSSRLNITV